MYAHQVAIGQKGHNMANTIGQMSREEFKEMIESVVGMAVEQKLLEILGDPDEGSETREAVRDRLLRQKQAVAAGERGVPLADVIQQLGQEQA